MRSDPDALHLVPALVPLPSLASMPGGGGAWTERFTARSLHRGTLAHPALWRALYAADQLSGQGITAFAAKTGLSIRDSHIELYDRLELEVPRFEAWILDSRPSTRGWYGRLLEDEHGDPMYGHQSDLIAVENYCESRGVMDATEVTALWRDHDAWIRRRITEIRLARKLRRPT